ncbi:FAD-binding protein [Actinophytocola sp.]|uniref:FAD-binding protein n=1 Tax=Actinophytocola sp. TaxID=1872138 RepID=UPI002D6E5D17|nr:FAD-binding protein [Actinophytocola sp.]HYQ63453.1 FAD-binding protein [Actinophytocola sp.]
MLQKLIPQLDGTLVATPAALAEHGRDLGNLVFGEPSAVLLPGSVRDIEAMVRFCAAHGIRTAARGEKHTTFGQGLTPHGLAVDMRGLDRIHHVDQHGADVDAGVLWRDLVTQAHSVGARFPALTGYLRLTVGGTLSVGGISPAYKLGAQVDLVRELQIVTGRGAAVWCSREHERDLFEAALAGLGQVGIITRVRLRMASVPASVRLHLLDYASGADAFAAMKLLCDKGQADELYCMVLPGPVYRLFVTEFGAPADLFGGVPEPAARQELDMPYLDYALSNDVMIDAVRADGTWDGLRKPWFDVFVPEEHAAPFMTSVVDRMTLADFAPGTGFVLVFPHNADGFTRPRLRVPAGTRRVYLCDVLSTDSADEGPAATYPERALARNATWTREARALGGYVYPIGSLRWTAADWAEHYGETWAAVRVAKLRWDPAGVLTPGPGIDFTDGPDEHGPGWR